MKFPSVTRNSSTKWRVNLPRWCWKYKRDKNENSLSLTLNIIARLCARGISCFLPDAKNIPPLLDATNKAFPTLENWRISKSSLRLKVSLAQKIHLWNNNVPLRRAAILATGKVHAYHSSMTHDVIHSWTIYLDEIKRTKGEKRKCVWEKLVVS